MMELISQETIKEELLKITAERTKEEIEIVKKVISFHFDDIGKYVRGSGNKIKIGGLGTFEVSVPKAKKQMKKLGLMADRLEEKINSGILNEKGERLYRSRLEITNRQISKIKSKFMRINFKGIMEGVWNSVFVKESVERVSKERLAVCSGCSLNSDHQKRYNEYQTFRPDLHCTVCMCNLQMKTRAMSEECPKQKWLAQMSKEEEYELNRKLNETDES